MSAHASSHFPPRHGSYWHLCLRTHQQVALFADWRCARAAAACLSHAPHWPQLQVLCWVLLPDRWTALVHAQDPAALRQACTAVRQAAATAVNRARGRGGTVWHPGMALAPLPPRADHRQFARQLVAAPLRAGLVTQLGAYPYWDAVWLTHRAAHAQPWTRPCTDASAA
ncbi:hypothetical protein [Xanthomonas maliensis]|uniref:hypothetical protein n=1 Tax=Xanthomonas maliensis TaxID=1321368 RepID=UPI00039F7A5E|nr:hypothetical protein [Xanthomonas maliensis]KAB7769170.1 hypothetical protein CKY51_08000 [Xanthomonas maliensis]